MPRRAAYVPLLLGTNWDEIRLWSAVYDSPVDKKPPAILEKQLGNIFGTRAHQAIETYGKADADYGDAVIHLLGDLLIRMPSIRLAESNSRRQPTYMYLFTYRSTSDYKKFDSAHGMEVPFVFGVIDDLDVIVFTGRDPSRQSVVKEVQQAWVNFARTGDPSAPSLSWPKYDVNARATMQLGITCKVVNDPNSAERRVWNGLPFDGVTPNTVSIWGLVWANEAP